MGNAWPFSRTGHRPGRGTGIPINLGLPDHSTFATLTPMAATEIDVKYVAHLARLALTPAEEEKMGAQLGQVLSYIEKLKELNVDGIEPTAHAVPLVNVSRPDVIKSSLPHAEAMRNAPAQANGLFMVPKIVD